MNLLGTGRSVNVRIGVERMFGRDARRGERRRYSLCARNAYFPNWTVMLFEKGAYRSSRASKPRFGCMTRGSLVVVAIVDVLVILDGSKFGTVGSDDDISSFISFVLFNQSVRKPDQPISVYKKSVIHSFTLHNNNQMHKKQ